MIERTDIGGRGSELELGSAVEAIYKWIKSKGSKGISPDDLMAGTKTLIKTGLMNKVEAERIPALVLELTGILDKFAKLTPTQVGGVCGLVQAAFYDPEAEVDDIMSVDDEVDEVDPSFNRGGFKDMDMPSGLDMERAVPEMEKPEYDKTLSNTDSEVEDSESDDTVINWKEDDEQSE